MPVLSLLFVLVAGMLLIPAGGAPAAGWQAPVNASPFDKYGALADIGLDAQGNATAVWTRYTHTPPNELFSRSVMVATRPFAGSWSAAVPISPPDEEAWVPKVAVNAAGDAVAAWGRWNFNEPAMLVGVATRPAGGVWSQPVLLSTRMSSGWRVAIDEDGNATAIWAQPVESGGPYVVRSASKPASGGWSSPVSLSDEDTEAEEHPELIVDPAGNVTAIWSLQESGEWVLQTKSRPSGGAWDTEATNLSSEEGNSTQPDLALGPDGEVTAVWVHSDGEEHAVQASRKDTGGEWSAAVDLSDDEAARPQIAVDPQDRATAIWGAFGPGGYKIRSSSLEAGGSWTQPVDLSTPDGTNFWFEAPDPELVVDPEGNATATWRAFAGSDAFGGEYFRLRAAHQPLGSAWSTGVDLSPVSESAASARLVVDAQGYATAIWPPGGVIRSRVFDAVAPELRDVTVPETGVVGQPVAMSVDPFDLFSTVSSSWDFGDGKSKTGAAVSHCYSSPGDYTVGLSGADGAANVSSASRAISIEPDPALAPGSDPCNPQPPDDPGPPDNPRPPDPGGPSNPNPGPTTPVVSDLQQASSRWRTPGARDRSRLPVGTTFRFELDRAAAVRLAFSRIAAGRQEGARCVNPTKANGDEPRCDRYQGRGALEIAGEAGENAYSFRGRIRGRTLKPGRYRLVVTALADGKTSAAASIEFTITR